MNGAGENISLPLRVSLNTERLTCLFFFFLSLLVQDYNDVRGFVRGGYEALGNNEGPLTSLVREGKQNRHLAVGSCNSGRRCHNDTED